MVCIGHEGRHEGGERKDAYTVASLRDPARMMQKRLALLVAPVSLTKCWQLRGPGARLCSCAHAMIFAVAMAGTRLADTYNRQP